MQVPERFLYARVVLHSFVSFQNSLSFYIRFLVSFPCLVHFSPLFCSSLPLSFFQPATNLNLTRVYITFAHPIESLSQNMVSLRTVAPGACAFVAAATTSHSSSSPTTSLHSSIDNNDPAPSADNSGNSPHTNTGMQHFTTHGSKAEATSSGKRTSSEHRASSTKLSSSCAHYPTSRADSPSMPWPPIKDVCNQRNVSLSEFTKAEADYSSVCHQEPTTDVWNKDDLGTLCEYLAVTGHTSDNSPPPIANAWIEFNPRFAKISCNYTGCDDGLLSDPASCGHSDDYPYYRPPLANMCLFSLSRFVGWLAKPFPKPFLSELIIV